VPISELYLVDLSVLNVSDHDHGAKPHFGIGEYFDLAFTFILLLTFLLGASQIVCAMGDHPRIYIR